MSGERRVPRLFFGESFEIEAFDTSKQIGSKSDAL